MAQSDKPPQEKLESMIAFTNLLSKARLTRMTEELKDIVQDLYELMVQTAAYDQVGSQIRSQDVLVTTLTHLHKSLTTLSTTANSLLPESSPLNDTNDPTPSSKDILIPPELLHYVDGGRNPDIYTREFVELARRGNQIMKGKQEAFGAFRDVLAREIGFGLPEVREDVRGVLEGAGVERGMGWEEGVTME